MGFTSDSGRADALENAILNNDYFQSLLNDLNVHVARVRVGDSTRTFTAFVSMKVALATNRNRQSGANNKESGISDLFGEELSQNIHYGLAEAQILDLSPGQDKATLKKRVWRAFTLGWADLRERRDRVVISRIDLMTRSEFAQLVSAFSGKGVVLSIHGYANSFDKAIRSSALGMHKAKVDRLELLPVLFSWPSRGKASAYLRDTAVAENSERALQEVVELVCRAATNREVDILSHSHGNKILVRSLVETSHKTVRNSPPLKRLILVEPDVDQEFFRQRADVLMKTSEQVIIYHSKNDRALSLASFLFESARLGKEGVPIETLERNSWDRIQVIDASLVARGLSKHAPHLESPEVISDIYHLLRGMKPRERFHLRHLNTGNWQMMPADA